MSMYDIANVIHRAFDWVAHNETVGVALLLIVLAGVILRIHEWETRN